QQQQQQQQQQHIQQRQSGHVPSPQQRPHSLPQNQGYRFPQQTQHHQYQQQQHAPQQQYQQQHSHVQQQPPTHAPASQPSPQLVQKQISSPAQPQAQQQTHQQQPHHGFQQHAQETVQQRVQKPVEEPVPEPAPEPIQNQQPELQQMHYVNLQDIQKLPPPPPVTMGQPQSHAVSLPQNTNTWPSQQDSSTVKPMDIMLSSPQAQPLPPPQPQPQPQPQSHQQPSQPQPQPQPQPQKTGVATPRVRPSPLSSVANSPAISARSPSITKKSPASTPKARPVDTVQMMVAVAEECFEKARASVHDVAMSLNATCIDEYQNLISTGLACLEACLQSNRLSPRQEAKMRLRYATLLLEETENPMEAETALTKGISLCEKHGMPDLKYYRQIADCETFKHPHWAYAFRLLKATFYIELGQTADASALENIRSIQAVAGSRGDNALCAFGFILEGLTLLKASKDGNIEKVQACIAQISKFQFDPSVRIMQLDMLTLLLDLASSINRSGSDLTAQKLKMVQDRMDEYVDWHNVRSDFLIPVKKQPSTGQTISSDTVGIIRSGGDEPVDYLVMSFMTKMELTSLVFTLTGLVNMHKASAEGRRSADFWREGLKLLDTWDSTTAGIKYGPSISLREAIQQREWRLETQSYLNIMLGLYAASHCQWDSVKQFMMKLETLVTPSTQGILRLLAIYLSGVFYQGTGDLQAAMDIFRSPAFDLAQRGTGVKTAHRELAMLAGLNRLWIMQHPSQRDDQETFDLMEQLEPLCSSHYNLALRTAWHNAMAPLVTDPPQQLNSAKQHIQIAVGATKSTNNVMGAAITLAIMRNRLFENIIGDQALKSAMAASKQAHRSGNILLQSVTDGMLAQSHETQGQWDDAAQVLHKATREAQEAFAGRS
ncbi:hypothetical protein F66182_4702, partial [Fusarium sp. NRRL 66182]